MPKYLFTGSYSTDGLKGVIAKGGSARVEAVRALADSLGGSLESFYFAFGGTDFYITVDLPDHTVAASLALTVNASGAVTAGTTVLLSAEEVDKATQLSPVYTPPGG